MKRSRLLPRPIIVLCAGLLALTVLVAQLALLTGGLPTPTLSLPRQAAPALHAGLTRLSSQVAGILGTPANWLADALGLQASTVRTLQQTGLMAGLWVAVLGLVLLLVLRRRSKRAYAAVVLSVIAAMLGTPLLQVQQVYAYQRQIARQAEARIRPTTLKEVDAAFNRALQTYINMPADLPPQERKLMESALEFQFENLAKQRQALMLSGEETTPQAAGASAPAHEAPSDGALARGLEDQTNNPAENKNPSTAVAPYPALPAGRDEEGPADNAYVWGMEAQNEETGQAASWLMTAQPKGDRQVFDEAFNNMIRNKPARATDGQDVPASSSRADSAAERTVRRLESAVNNPARGDKLSTADTARGTSASSQGLPASSEEPLTAETVLRRLENAANNPTDGEKPTTSPPALLYSRPGAEVTVEVTKIKIVDNCETGDAEWRLDVWIGGTKKEWNKDGVTDSWYDLNWNVDVALANDSATLDFSTGGVEEDTWSNDHLPSELWSHDSSDNWGVGTTSSNTDCGANPADPSTNHCRDLGPSDGCEYRLYYNVIAKKPFADMVLYSIDDEPGGTDANDLDYTISVWNDGPGDATGATLTVNLDAGLTYNPGRTTAGCTPSGNEINCTFDLTKYLEKVFTIGADVKPTTGGPVSTSASVAVNSSNNEDPNTGNNNKSFTTDYNDLELVSMSGPSEVGAGTQLDYDISVKNNGVFRPGAKLTVNLRAGLTYNSGRSTLPSGATCTPSGSTVTCDSFNISAGQELDFTIATDVALTANGEAATSATIALDQTGLSDTTSSNNTKSVTTNIVPNSDLGVSTDIPPSLAKESSGDTALDFTATIVNNGPTDATGVVFTDTLPTGVTYVSATPSQGASCTLSSGTVTCNLGSINKDATATVDIALTAPAAQAVGTTFTNVAGVTGDGIDSVSSNDIETKNTALTYWDTDVGSPGLDGAVNALASGSAYAGGEFSGNVQKWDGSSWAALGGGPGGAVHAIVVSGTTVYAGGDFAGYVKKWDGISWSTLGSSGPNNTVRALVMSGNDIYAGGDFTDIAGTTADYIARWNGATWEPFGKPDRPVQVIAAAGGDVYIAYSGSANGTVAQWNGASWEVLKDDLNPFGLGGPVYALAVVGGDLYVGGEFSSPVDGKPRRLARWDGSEWHDVGNGVCGGGSSVRALAANGSELFVGGNFTHVGANDPNTSCSDGTAAANVARWNGANWTALEGGALDTVKALAVGSSVYIGGDFTQVKTAAPASTPFTATRVTRWAPPTTNLSISKSATPNPVAPGGNVTFDLNVTNQGADATGVAVLDILPSGFTYQSQTGCDSASTSTSGSSGTVTAVKCDLGNLSSSASKTVQIVATAPTASGQYTNRAFVGADEPESDGTDNFATATVEAVLLTDLILTKDAPSSVKAGDPLTYTLTVRNDGPKDAPSVVVNDVLPSGVTYVSATPSQGSGCTQAEGIVTCSLGNLANGAQATITIVVNVGATMAAGAQLVNQASLTSVATDSNPGDTSPTTTTTVEVDADLVVSKSAPSTVHISANMVYELTVTNAGPSQATGVTLSDELPAGATFETVTRPGVMPHGCFYDSGNHIVNCTVGVLDPGTSAMFQIKVSMDQSLANGATLTNEATATANSPDSNSGNNSATAQTTVTTADPGALEAELGLSKSAPSSIGAGGVMTFTLQVKNNGPLDATNVQISDPVPAGLTLEASASSASCTESGGTVTCSAGTLYAGQSKTVYVAVRVPKSKAGETISNTAIASADQADFTLGNDSASTSTSVVPEADLVVSKSATASVKAGQDITYAITVTNNGPSDAAGVVLTDTLPSGVVDARLSDTTNCSESNNVVTCNIGPLVSGASFSVETTVTTFSPGAINNSAAVAGTVPDPVTSNNTASAGTDVGQPVRQTRDVGNTKVTANAFVDKGGGKVQALGSVTLGDYYKLSGTGDSVTIQGTSLTGNGTVTLVDGDLALFKGGFSADCSASQPLLKPDDNVSYELDKIAGFSISSGLAVSQANLSTGRADGSATLRVNPPGLDETVSAKFHISTGATFGGTVSDFSFVIAGFTFTMTNAAITDNGITKNTVTVAGPSRFGGRTDQVNNVQIGSSGLNINGAGATFSLPDISVADNPPTSTLLLTNATAQLSYAAGNYLIYAIGALSITLPGIQQSVNNVAARFDSDGNLHAIVTGLKFKIAGSTLEMKYGELTNEGLSLKTGSLKLDLVLIFKGPLHSSTPAITLNNVKITDAGLDMGGSYALPTAYLGVNNYIKFAGLHAAFVVSGTSMYVMDVHGKIHLDLPKNEHKELDFNAKIGPDGKFVGAGAINEVYIDLKVGPADVRLWNTGVLDNGLTTDEARVRVAWKKDSKCNDTTNECGPGAVQAAVDKLSIGADGIDFDAFRLGFRISDKIVIWKDKLVVTDAFMVFELPGPGKMSKDFAPGVGIEGTVAITVSKVSASATGRLIIDEFGNLRGTLEGFSLTVAGLGVKIDRAKYEKGIIYVQQATLQVPKSWGGFTVEVYNLEIGPDHFKIGGGKFALPDIKVGKIKLAGLYGEMLPVGDGYEIGAAGTFMIPGLGGGKTCGIKVGVWLYTDAFGALVMQIQTLDQGQTETPMGPQPQGVDAVNSLALKKVLVGLEGCAIPIGNTGFFLNRVEGSLMLNQGTTRIEIGVTIVGGPSFAGFYAVQGDVDLGLQFNPFQFDIAGAITLFAIFKAAQLNATVKEDFFSAKVMINAILIAPVPMSVTAEGSLTVWTTDGDFHLVGKLIVTFGLKKGSWGTLDVGLFSIDLPPWNLTLAEIGVEFGEFIKGDGTVWGFKGWVKIWKFGVGFYIDTDGDVDIGDVDSYKTVTPPKLLQARQLWRDVQDGRLRRVALSDAERTLLDDFRFTQDAAFINVNVPAQTDVLFALRRAGDEPTMTIFDPDGREIWPENLPSNVIYDTLEVTRTEGAAVVTDTLTVYSVGAAQPGVWQVKLMGEMGANDNLAVIGADPPPALDLLSAVAAGPTSAEVNWALTSDEVTTTLNIWATTGPITDSQVITTTEGLTKEVTSEVFTGFPITTNVTSKVDGTLNSLNLDLSGLESGAYYLWFEADDGNNPPTRAYAQIPVQVQQTWQDTWTANTTATPSFGQVEVNWDRSPNPDVDSYEVLIGTLSGVAERTEEVGNALATTISGLLPDTTYYVSVVAVDESTDPRRESTSEWISVTTDGAPFGLSASQTDFTVVGGSAVSLTLTVSTSRVYPEVVVGVTPVYTDDGSLWYVTPVTQAVTPTVGLSDGDVPDGIYLTLATEAVTPTLAGVEVGVVVSTTATMSGGDYTASIVGVSAGVSKTLNLNFTIQEPSFDLRASAGGTLAQRAPQTETAEVSETSAVSVTLTEGESASVTISADRYYGESDLVSLGVLGAPAGLLYNLSPTTISAGQSATLVMTDTELLANGTYTLTVTGFDGENSSNVDVVVNVEKPGFSLTTTADHQTAAAGETMTFTLELAPVLQWAYPITLTLDQFTYVPDATLGFVQNPGDPPASSITVNAPATVYLVVATGANTDQVTYRLGVESTSQDKAASLELFLEVAAADSADVGVDQPDNLSVVAGSSYTYTITLHNYGPAAAQNVVLTDTLPASYVTFNSAAGCSEASGVVTCNLGNLARDAEASVQVELDVDADTPAGAQLSNQAQVGMEGTNRNEDNNQKTGTATVSREADLAVNKAAPGQATAGAAMQYTLTVINNGPSEATSVTVSDTLSSGVTFDSASSGCTYTEFTHRVSCDLGSLMPPNTKQATIDVIVDPAQRDPLTNRASVSANESDPNATNNTSSAVQTTVAPQVGLQVTKTVNDATPDEGDTVNFTIVVDNAGPSAATGVTVSDPLPAGTIQAGPVTLEPSGAGAPGAPPTLASGLTLGAGERITFTLPAKVLDGPQSITNQVAVTSTEDATGVSATANVNVQNVAPTVAAGGPYQVPEGKNVVLAGSATDPGGSHDALTYVWDLDDDGVFGETGAAAARGDEVGASTTFLAPLVSATTDVSVTLRVSDGDGGSTDSQANITIQRIELALTKQDAPDPVRAGSRLTYTLTINNVGDAPADSVVLTDTLPASWITLASFTPPKGGKCTGTSTVVCSLPAIAVGATVVFTGVLDVHRDAPANEVLVNQAEVSSSASYTTATQSTIVYRTRATQPGDCNGDEAIGAADITAIVLWIFQGAYKGVSGCDANQDTRVDAGDIACTVLKIFGGPNACDLGGLNSGTGQPAPSDPDIPPAGPNLTIPGEMRVEDGGRRTVPVSFSANGRAISSLVFSVDYDEGWLNFDPTDSDGDGVPDAVHFDLPGQFDASVSFDEADSDGELDIFIADISPPLTGLDDGDIATITLDVHRAASTPPAVPVTFSQDPPASFGDTLGRSVPGTTVVERRTYRIYLPAVSR